jgi:hypothetical protein
MECSFYFSGSGIGSGRGLEACFGYGKSPGPLQHIPEIFTDRLLCLKKTFLSSSRRQQFDSVGVTGVLISSNMCSNLFPIAWVTDLFLTCHRISGALFSVNRVFSRW